MTSTAPDQAATLEGDLPDNPVCEGESDVCGCVGVCGRGWCVRVSVCGMRGGVL